MLGVLGARRLVEQFTQVKGSGVLLAYAHVAGSTSLLAGIQRDSLCSYPRWQQQQRRRAKWPSSSCLWWQNPEEQQKKQQRWLQAQQ
jgi:hypothetical protein